MPDTRTLYLDLLKKSLLHTLYPELDMSEWMPSGTIRDRVLRLLIPSKGRLYVPGDESTRLQGEDWPQMALTMIGAARLDNIQHCVETALRESIPGDFIETGVWRGGACIFMRGLLRPTRSSILPIGGACSTKSGIFQFP
jgi:O-methyltransferase